MPDEWSEEFLQSLGVSEAEMRHMAAIRELFDADSARR